MLSFTRHIARSGLSLRASLRCRKRSFCGGVYHAPLIISCTSTAKKYTEDHETVVFDDSTGIGIVSITDYAQSSLGDVVFVELPALETKVTKGDQIGAVESVKAASDIYAPISGTIREINENLNDQPGLLNKSPEDEGWLCKIEVSDPAELDSLMDEAGYKTHCDS
ncbi:single hybrid motif-containing protein [Thelephora terrestris]|uniref:Glycine cleavage system H protein n=1 Tax=Thelephora terrestris TaxID=56493 RepID=A0A9P6HGA5_9AGAM|nr:single hybrid motif-containing protein [Thelephora terrestris]